MPEQFALESLYKATCDLYCVLMFHINHYSDILKEEFEHRKYLNPSYTLRSFAKKLDIAPSKVSEVLNKKQGLSEKLALKISEHLNFSEEETDHFVITVKAHCAKSPRVKKDYQELLQSRMMKTEMLELQENVFSVISNWYYFAVLELIDTKDFVSNEKWIAKRLDVTDSEVKNALKTLESLGMVKINDGEYKTTGQNLKTTDGIGSSSIKKFNEQILKKAQEAIYSQNIKQRHISTLTTGLNDEILPEVFEKISNFRSELNQFITKHPKNKNNTNKVYCFSSQFFELTNEERYENDH